MIWSGFLIYWANPQYTAFIPASFYHALKLDYRLSFGMGIHFFLMWLFTINGILYCAYMLFSGEWRDLIPRRKDLKDAPQVFLHDLGLRKDLPLQGKLNAAQKIAYTAIVFMGGVAVLSGLAIYKPTQLGFLTAVFAGYEGARLVHFVLALSFIGFFFLHVVQVIRAGWNNFQAMITGLEKETDASDSK